MGVGRIEEYPEKHFWEDILWTQRKKEYAEPDHRLVFWGREPAPLCQQGGVTFLLETRGTWWESNYFDLWEGHWDWQFIKIPDFISNTLIADVRERFHHVMGESYYDWNNSAAGREYVSAFIDFIIYLHNLSTSIPGEEEIS